MKVASAMTTTHARVRAIAGTLAVVLCAAAMFCARFAGARGGPPWEGAGASESESESLAFEGFGRVARAALGNLAVGTHGYGKDDRVGMYGREGEGVEGGGDDGWTVRTTMFMRAAKVLACASAACAVAAVSAVGEPEGVSTAHVGGVAKATSPRSVVTKPTTKFKQGDSDGAESPRGGVGGSPRTPGSESGRRGGRSLEEVARAKELAKERKRQARAEQELIAKKEEEDRAEIAALVVQERAKREARRAEEELARRMREKEEARVAEALAASLESLEEEKRKLREQQEQEKEREAAEKDTMHSTGSGSGSGSGRLLSDDFLAIASDRLSNIMSLYSSLLTEAQATARSETPTLYAVTSQIQGQKLIEKRDGLFVILSLALGGMLALVIALLLPARSTSQ